MNFRLPIRKCLETLILIVFLLFPSALLAHQFKVIRVYDGDTIKVEGYGTQAVIRLAGIDAPEAAIRNVNQPNHFIRRPNVA